MLAKLAGGAGALALLAFLIWLYGGSRERAGALQERLQWQGELAAKNEEISLLNLAMADRAKEAAENYAERISEIEPVIVENARTIERYAQTPAGRVECLSAERVRGIEATAAELALHSASASGLAGGAMQPHADPH